MPKSTTKTTHTTLQQRLEIAEYKQKHPNSTQKQIQDWFYSKYNTIISQPSLSRILNAPTNTNTPAHLLQRKNTKTGTNTTLENALYQWFSINQYKLNITNEMLQFKARELAGNFAFSGQLNTIEYSTGWLERFKKRFNIKSRFKHGEAASIPTIQNDKINEIKDQLSNYNPEDIYNMDETALFYRLQGQHSLSNAQIPGFKLPKDRITLVLCTNSTGSHKLPLWIIGKYKNPRAFKSINTTRLPAIYKSNKKAWMNTILFKEWIHWLDIQVKRPILLVMDNFSAHTMDYNLKNIKTLFLPPNTTTKLQPLDAGIIHAFKAHYRKLYGLQLLQDLNTNATKLGHINVLNALFLASEAWESVNTKTIYNCFKHTGLFHQYNTENSNLNAQLQQLQEELQQVQLQLPMAIRMDINTLLNSPLEAARSVDILTDEDIIDLVSQEEEEISLEEQEEIVPAINTTAAIQNIKELQQFVLEKVENDEKAKQYSSQLQKLLIDLQSSQFKKAKQTKISDFFSQ